jgi:hypothetical protein
MGEVQACGPLIGFDEVAGVTARTTGELGLLAQQQALVVARRSGLSSGTMRSAFARAMDVRSRSPAAGSHAERAVVAYGDHPAQEVRESRVTVTGSSSTTGVGRRKSLVWPSMRRTTGRANSSKVTIADTGLPGSAIHGVPSSEPKPMGAPGRMRTFQKSSVAPNDDSTVSRTLHRGAG